MEATEQDPLDVDAIRADFPILDREVSDGQRLVYLDNAATTQTPEQVVDVFSDYYRGYNANVHRGIHQLSQEASIAYEEAHDRLADFVGADGREEMIFTKNTTESINLVAYAWGLNELSEGDAVVLSEMEHHSSFVTWREIAKKVGAEVRYIRVDENGYLDMDHAAELIDEDVEMVSVVHASNVLGTVNPMRELADLAHEQDALILGDGAQSVPNRPVDVKELDVDFYVFSGHKMAGPTGIGGLYGKQEILEDMEPFLYGGDMIRRVSFEDTTWNDLPWKYEAGTPLIAQGIALAEAADYLDDVGMEAIQAHEERITEYAYERLDEFDDVEIYGPPADDRGAVVAFNVDGIHAHDLASILNDHGVAIRAGDHCTQPLHQKLDIAASVRASFYLYNTKEEVDALVDSLDAAREIFN
ncbi:MULTISPECIES: aminotransferase class V-fold PLP-dependent enzyme [unclassified Halobacterium]|uniref:aminotransferase class V-fold PLP-dependent enzyme n=1 Tax=unclassified Halobacterium TaxID=2668073 RepID=UPI001E391118|nr:MULTISPECIES: cysteine desulfurase [unclassified Halobacterium]MCD2199054.1 cysteine desulfurase [Halobacterium sp. KA-4]MCD2203077.1 cysteine desulfurase [Halobacterium sp. KA-6]